MCTCHITYTMRPLCNSQCQPHGHRPKTKKFKIWNTRQLPAQKVTRTVVSGNGAAHPEVFKLNMRVEKRTQDRDAAPEKARDAAMLEAELLKCKIAEWRANKQPRCITQFCTNVQFLILVFFSQGKPSQLGSRRAKPRKKRKSIAPGKGERVRETLADVADQAFIRTAASNTSELIARFGAKWLGASNKLAVTTVLHSGVTAL
jgi:hypothetical protein